MENTWAQPADQPAPRADANSKLAHEQMLANLKKGKIDVYFAGDSITRRWRATDYPKFLANWNENFLGWNAANFGWGGDRIQNILWRLQNGEIDGVHPKVIVLLAGTNNLGNAAASDAKIADITRGIKTLVETLREKAPKATIIVMGILPRNDGPNATAVIPSINKINEKIAQLADGKTTRYLNINDKLADKDGKLLEGMSADRLHLSVKGYQVWADVLKPLLTELLGPPAKEDHAPPPTGDPSARPKEKGAEGAGVQGGYPLFAPFAPFCPVCTLLPGLHPSDDLRCALQVMHTHLPRDTLRMTCAAPCEFCTHTPRESAAAGRMTCAAPCEFHTHAHPDTPLG